MWHAHDGMGWWMMFGGIWMVIFWAAIIWLIVWGVAQISDRNRESESPMDIARRRYARGEITSEQFEQLKRDLT